MQVAPQTIIALRYFYEIMPELHIIAAGSLLDFAIAQVGIPVGRVEFLYMYPLSFIEYLAATEKSSYDFSSIQQILNHNLNTPISWGAHDNVLRSLSYYLALGGMPEVIHKSIVTQTAFDSHTTQVLILSTYRSDFEKYARMHEIKSGDGRTLRSLRSFLDTHQESPYGIRFSTNNYSTHENIHSYPLYTIVKILIDHNLEMKNAIESLIT